MNIKNTVICLTLKTIVGLGVLTIVRFLKKDPIDDKKLYLELYPEKKYGLLNKSQRNRNKTEIGTLTVNTEIETKKPRAKERSKYYWYLNKEIK